MTDRRIQEEYAKLLRGQQSSAVNESSASDKVDEVKKTAASEVVEWQQNEQRLFEAALQKYPKGTEER